MLPYPATRPSSFPLTMVEVVSTSSQSSSQQTRLIGHPLNSLKPSFTRLPETDAEAAVCCTSGPCRIVWIQSIMEYTGLWVQHEAP